MVKLKVFFIRNIVSVSVLLILVIGTMNGQGNCLIYPEKSGERKACELSYKAIEYKQGSRESQLLFDEAIEVGPKYAWAYYQKAVPYFKRGLLNEGVKLINKAIELEPKSFYLTYRAYWYFNHESYSACIADLERYYYQQKGPLTFTPGGDLEMRLMLALAHAKSNNHDEAIKAALNCIKAYGLKEHLIGLYDYHVLGMLYFQNGQFEEASRALEKQIEVNPDLVDSYYYLGLINKEKSEYDKAEKLFQETLYKLENKDKAYQRFGYGFGINKADVQSELTP